jgi:CRISPR/Cas system-associated exonuclease Cas4 (RecB family)
MGFPLKQTLVYTLLKHLMDLQRNSSVTEHLVRFSYKDVISILKHTLMTGLMRESDKEIISGITKTNLVWVSSDHFTRSEHLSRVFIKPVTSALLSDYFKNILSLLALSDEGTLDKSGDSRVERNIRNEFIYRMVLSINRLEVIADTPDVSFSTETYMRILDRMLRIQSVPFSGEPLSGIQIMGILETRALDFKNLIMLSVNEGVLPSVSSGSSFIPFSLREAFGLPSVNHQESIYAYHFYRLLQRAENVTFIYNSNSEGLKSGEMSRFLIQMKYDPILKPIFLDLSFEIKTQGSIGKRVERTEEHIRQLNSLFLEKSNRRILSPSAINTWLNCSMKFYYRYVNGLKESVVPTGDIDHAMLGNILHDIMKNLYYEFINQVLTRDRLDLFISDKQLVERIINNAINEKFNKGADSTIEGNESIVRDVLKAYVMKILRTDKSLAPFKILNLEDSFSFTLPLPSGDSQMEVLTGGKVDRIDVVDGVTRIVDYKTGLVADTINSIGDLFANDRKKDSDGWLQTLIYCEAYLASNPGTGIRPSVYKIRKLTGASPADKLRLKTNTKSEMVIDDYQMVRGDFVKNLKTIVATILSKEEPFTMTSNIRGKCSYCPYKALCIR